VDIDPAMEARKERKERVAKNERQHLQNLARAQHVDRKREIDRTLATTRSSTASMGKFDRSLEGEKKLRGVKRKVPPFPLPPSLPDVLTFGVVAKFDPIEKAVETERSTNLALVKQIGNGNGAPGRSSLKKARRDGGDGDGEVVNVRKAVRFASGGQGAAALARKSAGGKQKRKGKRY